MKDTETSLTGAAPETPFPEGTRPMLATLINEPFDEPGWLYEVKWDGYRTMVFIREGQVDLLSRNQKSFNEKFYPLYEAFLGWKVNAVVDGEIMVLNKKGVSDFSALQNWRSEADGDLVFYAFDILWYEGKDLMNMPLSDRREVLKAVLPDHDDRIRLSEIFEGSANDFFSAAQRMGLEGIMAKKADSVYIPDFRSHDWLKIKVHKRQEVVIGGFTRNEGTPKKFSSLLLGVYGPDGFNYVGKVGTGFNNRLQNELMSQFERLIIDKPPFRVVPDYNKPSRFRPNPPKAEATWLKPELVCEISFAEVTSDGVFRHPSFEGMRSDKDPRSVVRETEARVEEIVAEEKNGRDRNMVKAPQSRAAKTLLNPSDETQVRNISGFNLKLTHLGKVLWPDEGVTKRDMLNYYYQVADFILPYLQGRPQTLNRFPNGIRGKSFYQKNVKETAPEWAETFPYVTSEGEHKEFLVITNEASLLWMASLGCIEMNPWFSRTETPDNPDYCVIDLDPDKNSFEQVIEAAQVVKKVLDSLGVPCWCKTSGSTGLHIYIPLAAKYSYDQSQMFGRMIAGIVHKEIPGYTSVERQIKNRSGKMYIDFLQNRPGATLACPYSLRPKPGATVSMPLHWDEVKPGLSMKDFTIFNAVERLKVEGDLFREVLGTGIDLEQVVPKAKRIFG